MNYCKQHHVLKKSDWLHQDFTETCVSSVVSTLARWYAYKPGQLPVYLDLRKRKKKKKKRKLQKRRGGGGGEEEKSKKETNVENLPLLEHHPEKRKRKPNKINNKTKSSLHSIQISQFSSI